MDRIRERTETQIYVERVFEGLIETIDQIFPDQDQREVARAAVKLLILFAISPVKYKYTVRHLAEMILFPITSLESEINYQFLHDILDRLARDGLYLRVEKGRDSLEDHFFVDLKADMAGLLRRTIKHRASLVYPSDRRLFWKTAALADSPYLPLSDWVEKGRQQVTTRWQHTLRSGTLLLRQLDEVSPEDIDTYARRQERSEEDYFVIVGTTHDREVQYRHVKETLLPRIRGAYRGTFLFWLPAPIEGDIEWIKETLAAVMMEEEMTSGIRDKSQELKDLLGAFLSRQKKRITDHYNGLYYHGILLWDEGEIDLSGVGVLSQEKFLSEFVPPLLEQRFPKHGRIQPYMDFLPLGVVKDMLMEFLSRGILIADDRSKTSIRDVLEGILIPMGLARKKGNQYELTISPRQNELARCLLELMEAKDSVPLEEIYWKLRKGEYGLQMPYFEILALALLFSGHLVAYKVMERKTPQELFRTGLKGITALGRGEGGSFDAREEEFRAFLESEFRQLAPLYYEVGHEQFIKAMAMTLWARQYELPGQELAEAFPFLKMGTDSEIRPWLNHLEDLARALRKEKGELFEYCVNTAEQDPGFTQLLWSLLPAKSPEEIFNEESVFPSVLKEAFERIICGEIGELGLKSLTSTSPPSDGKEVVPLVAKKKGEMLEILKTYQELRKNMAILASVKDKLPDSFSRWESIYVQTMSPLPFLRETLQDQLKHMGITLPPFLKQELRYVDERLHEVSDSFAGFYNNNIPGWEKSGASRPTMIEDLPSMLSRKRNVPDHQRVCYVLMDGMRWDLWEYIKAHFFGKMPNFFRIVREGALWSGLPTSTESQLGRFEGALHSRTNGVDGDFPWKISGVDEKIHSERGPLTHLFANVVNYLEIEVLLRLRDLPPRTLLFLFSDHGFVENPSFNLDNKYESPRYIHGKDSPFEVIVPWAWIMRI
ncbi:MAG: hypothetical protein JRJ03_01910 [Deltaproteobacteria bacterium]|nr:hypothetical protein [Deltaproteobacteria bacterium]